MCFEHVRSINIECKVYEKLEKVESYVALPGLQLFVRDPDAFTLNILSKLKSITCTFLLHQLGVFFHAPNNFLLRTTILLTLLNLITFLYEDKGVEIK